VRELLNGDSSCLMIRMDCHRDDCMQALHSAHVEVKAIDGEAKAGLCSLPTAWAPDVLGGMGIPLLLLPGDTQAWHEEPGTSRLPCAHSMVTREADLLVVCCRVSTLWAPLPVRRCSTA
jgi:hypothetical protein